MSNVKFTLAELKAIQEVSAHILSILDGPSLDAWAEEAMASVAPLVGGDRAFLAVPEGEDLRIFWTDEDMEEALAVYRAEFAPHDFLLQERGRERGPEGYILPVLADDEELSGSVIWEEWALPHRICDVSGFAVYDLGLPLPPLLNVYHERLQTDRFGVRELAVYHLLFPAFKTAVRLGALLGSDRAGLPSEIDRLSVPLLVLDGEGRVLHRSGALGRRLAIPTVERRVLAEAGELARRLAAAASGNGHATAAGFREEHPPVPAPRARVDGGPLGTLELEGVRLAGAGFGSALRILVHVRSLARTLPRPDELRDRFGLTPRETEVALLLARRLSNKEIAEALYISPNTARHHTEHIFDKLHVSDRRKAARVIAGEAAPND